MQENIPSVEIILVKYGQKEYEDETIEQVLKCTKDYNLTIYDNWFRDANLSTVWNELIKRSDAEFICLLNTDTVVSEGWLDELLKVLRNPKVGAVGPVSNRAGGHQGGWEKSPKNSTEECTMLSGFCLVFPKKVWEEVGGFDERFKLYGEDSDFCFRIRKAGYKLMTHYGVWIFHWGAKSSESAKRRGKDIAKIQRESSELFQRKIR